MFTWRSADELEAALERGDLRYAMALAEELRSDGHRISLDTAARFLPLIVQESPSEYDARGRFGGCPDGRERRARRLTTLPTACCARP